MKGEGEVYVRLEIFYENPTFKFDKAFWRVIDRPRWEYVEIWGKKWRF